MIESGTFLQQRYRINKQIGQGGMGAVYVATDERFSSMVAIKQTLLMDQNFRKAIEREARLLNSLKHSALPRVSDHFVEDAGQFIVMEYIQGEDLHEILARENKPFPVETVLLWADQILDALEYLHTQADPVVHRDIKPQNLKVTSRGQVVLLDFGLAKGNPTDGGQHTAAKSIFGYSRNYASLEQIQGTGTDPRSDLYSLAATLYHLITNAAPDDALTRAMSVLGQNGDPLKPANVVNPLVPAGVAGVLQKALSLNAVDRPSSAAEMRQMLRESEKYERLAQPSAIAVSTDALAHGQTRLMPEETRAGAYSDETDVRTQILPGGSPQATSVRSDVDPRGTNVQYANVLPHRNRHGLVTGVAALLLLLVGGAVAGGLYLIKPSLFGAGVTNSNSETSPISVSPSNVVADQPVNTEQQVRSADSLVDANTAASESSKQPGKSIETAKSKVANDKSKPSGENGETTDITMDDPNDPENVTITTRDKNGKVTTMHVNPKAQPPNMPDLPPDVFEPLPRDFNPNRPMTPAEKARLRRMIQQRIRNANIQPKE
jgi:serine/threonine protein kinase